MINKRKLEKIISVMSVGFIVLGSGALAVSGDSGIDDNFNVVAEHDANGKVFTSKRGPLVGGGNGGGNSPGAIESTLVLTIAAPFEVEWTGEFCTAGSNLRGAYFHGVGANSQLESPTGAVTPLVEGFNAMDDSGDWSIHGTFNRIATFDLSDPDDSYFTGDCIVEIKEWGETATTSARGLFAHGGRALTRIENLPSTLTDVHGMFKYASVVPNLSNVDWSNVTDMSQMFMNRNMSNYDFSSWDVSSVENFDHMFSDANLWGAHGLDAWETGSATSMRGMFSNGNSRDRFNYSLNNWDVSNVTDMACMFLGEMSRNGYDQPLDEWDTSSVVDMDNMFAFSEFNQDISGWDVSQVTRYGEVFANAAIYEEFMPNFTNSNTSTGLADGYPNCFLTPSDDWGV